MNDGDCKSTLAGTMFYLRAKKKKAHPAYSSHSGRRHWRPRGDVESIARRAASIRSEIFRKRRVRPRIIMSLELFTRVEHVTPYGVRK